MKKLKQINFQWIKQAFWIFLLAGLFLYLNSSPPFMAIASNSMEPVLSRGDLIFSTNIAPDEIQVGDVIVYKVAETFQEKYSYPPSVCHRVIRIDKSNGELYFRTKGDNTGEDPFMVSSAQIIGKESTSVPYVGYLVMFPQSRQGWFFLGGLVILILLYCNSDYLLKTGKKLRQAFTGVSSSEFAQSQDAIEHKMELMSDQVSQSMNNFSSAMSEYAKHIASHTSAIKSLAQAAQHMESILAKQDSIFLPQPQPDSQPSLTVEKKPEIHGVEVTPDLKAAVKEFIQQYCVQHGITDVTVTPELRSAVWEFIQDYVKKPRRLLRTSSVSDNTVQEPLEESDTEDSELRAG